MATGGAFGGAGLALLRAMASVRSRPSMASGMESEIQAPTKLADQTIQYLTELLVTKYDCTTTVLYSYGWLLQYSGVLPYSRSRYTHRELPHRPGTHPRHSTPHYGVIEAGQVRYRAPIMVGPAERPNAASPLFRLVTDMQGRF